MRIVAAATAIVGIVCGVACASTLNQIDPPNNALVVPCFGADGGPTGTNCPEYSICGGDPAAIGCPDGMCCDVGSPDAPAIGVKRPIPQTDGGVR
jgi:hypothetical protein